MWIPPTAEDFVALASQYYFSVGNEELEAFLELAKSRVSDLESLRLETPTPPAVEAVREVGAPATRQEDPLNAIIRWCSVRIPGQGGLLEGLRLAVKDTIPVSGLPMSCASTLLSDFVPDMDALVVERVISAGAEIVATTNMDSFACSGGGESSSFGPTRNPFDPTRTAGGSSGGSAAALHYDAVDIALGGDQGGSVRLPASWCGVLGLKPTRGLVPYTGVAGLDRTVDHVGPMATSVAHVARLLQAIAGAPEPQDGETGRTYLDAALRAPETLRGTRIAVLKEGFEPAHVEARVASAVMEAVARLEGLGAEVIEASVPEHLTAGPVANAIFAEGAAAFFAGTTNHIWDERSWPQLSEELAARLPEHGDELSTPAKFLTLFGAYLKSTYGGAVYAHAHRAVAALTRAYRSVLADADLLVVPTTPWPAHELGGTTPVKDYLERGWSLVVNTHQCNLTGNPALSLPAAETDGLPLGVMLIARPFEEARLIAAARLYEATFGWLPERR